MSAILSPWSQPQRVNDKDYISLAFAPGLVTVGYPMCVTCPYDADQITSAYAGMLYNPIAAV